MRVVLFCHSILSDWNHGNAHFLRGVVTELQRRGHSVRILEPRDGWSAANLVADAGHDALERVHAFYPSFDVTRYDPDALDLDVALDGAELVLVHEWNSHRLVEQIGRHHARGGAYVLLFHDTHHRSVTDAASMAGYDLSSYDGVLAFGEVIRERYVERGWARRAWTWHEAADVRTFCPRAAAGTEAVTAEEPDHTPDGDLVWIGNWGDEERSQEIREFLINPVKELGIRARVHGVRYPPAAQLELGEAGIAYAGWLPNYRVPEVFARFKLTVHIPRGPYVSALPGIPTIRMFEALACGIPLVSCVWHDAEGLFRTGADYLSVQTPTQMTAAVRDVLHDSDLAAQLACSGLETILARHTCAHRVDELLSIAATINVPVEKAVTV